MITLKQAAAWCGGTVLPEYENVEFSGACNDSRTIRPRQLFVALRAERDGHDFIQNAMAEGAAAALGERQLPGVPMIVAPDSLEALAQIAAGWRSCLVNTRFIGLTGSVGKTSTKEMLADACSCVLRTGKTAENQNNLIGVSMTLLGFGPELQAAVVEMGMNHAGELSRLTRIVRPHVAVITNIGTMHIENLGSRKGICQAKLEILEGLEPGGVAVLNGDEPLLREAAPACRTLWFGLGPNNDLRAEDVHPTLGGLAFTAVGLGKRLPVEFPVPGVHYAMDALAAILAAYCVKVPLQAAAACLRSFHNVGNRLRITRSGPFTCIADCYNAGPESTKAALDVLQSYPAAGRRIAVLGDMLELGGYAPIAHRTVGMQAAQAADLILAFGPLSRNTVEAAGEKARWFESREALLEALRRAACPGDVILFKASHGMHLEKVLEEFTK